MQLQYQTSQLKFSLNCFSKIPLNENVMSDIISFKSSLNIFTKNRANAVSISNFTVEI